MTALEYMEKQATRHRRNCVSELERGAPKEMLERITRKAEYYESAVEAFRLNEALLEEIKGMCFLCRRWNRGSGEGLCRSCEGGGNFEWRGPREVKV